MIFLNNDKKISAISLSLIPCGTRKIKFFWMF